MKSPSERFRKQSGPELEAGFTRETEAGFRDLLNAQLDYIGALQATHNHHFTERINKNFSKAVPVPETIKRQIQILQVSNFATIAQAYDNAVVLALEIKKMYKNPDQAKDLGATVEKLLKEKQAWDKDVQSELARTVSPGSTQRK